MKDATSLLWNKPPPAITEEEDSQETIGSGRG